MTLEEWATLKQPALLDVGPFTIARAVSIQTRKTRGYVVFLTASPYRVFFTRTLKGLETFFGLDPAHLDGRVSTEYAAKEDALKLTRPTPGEWLRQLPGLS